MKYLKKIIYLLLIIAIVVFGLTFYLKNQLPKKAAEQPQVGQPIIDNTLKETSAELMAPETPAELRTFNFQIEQFAAGVSVSWPESEIKIFYLILLDKKAFEQGEGEPLVWGISALGESAPDLLKIEKLKTFLPSPYIIGEKKEGFIVSKEDSLILEKNKEYWLQLTGLDNDKKVKFTSKIFTFGQK